MWREQHCLLCGLVFLFSPPHPILSLRSLADATAIFLLQEIQMTAFSHPFCFPILPTKLAASSSCPESRCYSTAGRLGLYLYWSVYLLEDFFCKSFHIVSTQTSTVEISHPNIILITISRLLTWASMIKMFLVWTFGPPFVNSGLHLSGHYKEAKLIKYLRETLV